MHIIFEELSLVDNWNFIRENIVDLIAITDTMSSHKDHDVRDHKSTIKAQFTEYEKWKQ
jgi:hypothetical protein